MVNFEDGKLVKGAYVLINGIEYPVVMPEYAGKTAMSSENLNKLQNDLQQQIDTNNLELTNLIGNVLYKDEVGATGNINLNDAIENYDCFEIESYVVYANQRVYNNTGKLPIESKSRIHINNLFIPTSGGTTVYNKRCAILGTQLTVNSDRELASDVMLNGNYTYITKVMGYKEAQNDI